MANEFDTPDLVVIVFDVSAAAAAAAAAAATALFDEVYEVHSD